MCNCQISQNYFKVTFFFDDEDVVLFFAGEDLQVHFFVQDLPLICLTASNQNSSLRPSGRPLFSHK